MEIRHLEYSADARAVIRINALAWREAYRNILPDETLAEFETNPSEERVQKAFERLYDDRDGLLVAEDDNGTVRGYSYFRWGEDTKEFVGEKAAGLKEIYIEPDYWGNGIGTTLLERGLELLPESIERVQLEMLDGNDVGRQFYSARGFDRTGESEFEIRGETYPTSIYTLEL